MLSSWLSAGNASVDDVSPGSSKVNRRGDSRDARDVESCADEVGFCSSFALPALFPSAFELLRSRRKSPVPSIAAFLNEPLLLRPCCSRAAAIAELRCTGSSRSLFFATSSDEGGVSEVCERRKGSRAKTEPDMLRLWVLGETSGRLRTGLVDVAVEEEEERSRLRAAGFSRAGVSSCMLMSCVEGWIAALITSERRVT